MESTTMRLKFPLVTRRFLKRIANKAKGDIKFLLYLIEKVPVGNIMSEADSQISRKKKIKDD